MVLLASSTLAVAMNVAVQVLPPSAVCKLLNVPFSTVTSRKIKAGDHFAEAESHHSGFT